MSSTKILVIDDEPDIREVLRDILEDEGFEVHCAENSQLGDVMMQTLNPDAVLLDVWMPGEDGLSLYRRWAESGLDLVPVIMISGHGTIEHAVEATQLGAYDFLEKPLSTAKLLIVLKRALETRALKRQNAVLQYKQESDLPLFGESDVIKDIRSALEQIAPTEGRVFITGESGTGKGAVATAIHNASPRSDAPCIHLNLAAIPRVDLPMRLFGAERNGETIKGQLELAQGGTLVIDEVGDLDADLQTQLVRVLEAGSVTRLGGSVPITIDVRIISTTTQDMSALLQTGRFQPDLYHRLNVLPLVMPSLRNRVDDIRLLVEALVEHFVAEERLTMREFSDDAYEVLRQYSWPGNIRELRNFTQRVLIMVRAKIITADVVRQHLGGATTTISTPIGLEFDENQDLKQARLLFEKRYFENLISECSGNMTQVAKLAGVERTHLYRKLKNLGISIKRTQ